MFELGFQRRDHLISLVQQRHNFVCNPVECFLIVEQLRQESQYFFLNPIFANRFLIAFVPFGGGAFIVAVDHAIPKREWVRIFCFFDGYRALKSNPRGYEDPLGFWIFMLEVNLCV